MSNTWLNMSASDLGRAIGRTEIDPVDLTDEFLNAVNTHDFSSRIYARVTSKRARAEAKAASERAKLGLRRGVLDGVPISWKDLFDSAGVATEAGSALLKDRVPNADAKCLANATAAGLVCLGKTHMSELAFSGLGLNPVTATSPCVNDHEAVSGGSSSGAATSVAFGLAAAGIGSDTGGSVRIPSAWNDLVGLKTSLNRVSVAGTVPLCKSFDTVGPLCRTVEDAAELFAVLVAEKPVDLTGARLEGMRVAVLEAPSIDAVRAEPKAGFQSAVARLEDAGLSTKRVEFPEIEDALELSGVLFAAEAYAEWENVIEANPDLMFPEILNRFRGGKDVSATENLQAWHRLNEIRQSWTERFAGYDAVALPTSPILPPNIERLLTDQDYYVPENLLALRLTRIGNLMGLCGLTLPTGLPSTGIMFLVPAMQEERVLRLGVAAEEALS